MIPRAAAITFILGLLCGFGLFTGFVAALLIVLAQGSGAGWRSRHVAGKLRRTQ